MERAESSDVESSTGQQERELATRVLQIQAKRFYVDVKENNRGRFIKLAEVATGRRKNRIILPMSIAPEFRNRLAEFHDASQNLVPGSQPPASEDGKLKSAVIVKDYRRYYLDLMENNRGRFLRISLVSRGARSQIGIPAVGIGRLRDTFSDLIEEFSTEEERFEEPAIAFRGDIPESRSIRVENKTFFFDVGQNERGVYMKISEVKQNFRSSITIPEKSWSRMRDIVGELITEVREQSSEAPRSSHQASGSGS